MSEEALDIVKDYRTIFKSKRGKRVLLDMAKNSSVFTGSSELNPQKMAFKEGQRDIVFNILKMIDMKYEDIIKLYTTDWEGEDNE